MRLKLRHTMRRTQAEIDASFNPINLDYIFEEDDPLSPWLVEREVPLLDGRDDNEWLNLSDDDESNPATQEQQRQPFKGTSSSATTYNSGGGGGLSPPSENDGGRTQSGGEPEHSGGCLSLFFQGECGLGTFVNDAEVGTGSKASKYLPLRPTRTTGSDMGGSQSRRKRQAHHPLSEESSTENLIQSLGDFGLGYTSSQGNWDPPYESYPPPYTSFADQSYHYPPPVQNPDYPFPYQLDVSALVVYTERRNEDIEYGVFNYVLSTRWGDEQDQSHGYSVDQPRHSFWGAQQQSEQGGSEDQPIHSFWW